MLRLAVRELIVRRTATVLVALGLITATVGFVVLAGTAQTTRAVLSRDIASVWPAPYDILVRPRESQDQLEASAGLVRPNYLSGLLGGITTRQLEQVGTIPGVQVAAPIAIVGFAFWPVQQLVDLTPLIDPEKITFFRLSFASTGDGGRSIYPAETILIAASASGRTVFDRSTEHPEGGQITLESPYGVYRCTLPERCLAPTDCGGAHPPPTTTCSPLDPERPGSVGWVVPYAEPILIAGIDPEAEGKLAGLDRCVAQGRYLRAEDEAEFTTHAFRNQPMTAVPVLVSTHSFIDESVSIRLERATATNLDGPIATIANWGVVTTNATTADVLYRSFLPSVTLNSISSGPLYEIGRVRYHPVGTDHFRIDPIAPDTKVLADIQQRYWRGQLALPEASDVWLRPVAEAKQPGPPGMFPIYHWSWSEVGTYDPNCLPAFATTGGRMDAYTVPEVRTQDGQVLLPTRSLASYANSPPLVLTTLAGAKFLANALDGGPPPSALISAIRVRLNGTEKFNPAAESRLARVAAEIDRTTGLQADIIRGSSPRPVLVDLPAGKFGRPALTVAEGWSAKGVAFRFGRATSLTNIVLFVVALLASTLLVAQTAYTGVRQRRRELAMLHALGWPPWRLALLVEMEAAVVGLAAGLIAPAIAYLVITRLSVGIQPASPLLAAPLAVVVALIAALVPAMMAARVRPVDAMSERGRVRRSRPLWSAVSLGARNLLHAWGAEAAAAVAGLWLAASLVGILLLLIVGFRGQLDTSVLGITLAEHVAPYHVALIAITVLIGLLGAAEVLTLSYLERRPQLALLRALGWPRPAIAGLIIGEGAVIAAAAAVAAVVTVVAIGFGLGATPVVMALASVAAVATAVVITFAALLIPAVMGFAIDPAQGLHRT
jgi:hypothetical protein